MDPNFPQFDLVIHHGPCPDGFGAAYIALRAHREHQLPLPRLVAMDHNNPSSLGPPPVRGLRVLMVDIALDRATMDRMNAEAAYFLVLDHHKTAQEALRGAPYARFSAENAAVHMAWELFYPHQPDEMPPFLHYIGLRDVWKHEKDANARAWCAAFVPEFTPEAYRSHEDPDTVALLISSGKAIEAHTKYRLEALLERATEHTWRLVDNYVQVLLLNTLADISELGALLVRQPNREHCVAMLWSKRAGSPTAISLRSGPEGPDVGELARLMGGGGHKHAAGFRWEGFPEELFE